MPNIRHRVFSILRVLIFFTLSSLGFEISANELSQNPFINDTTKGSSNASLKRGAQIGKAETIAGNVYGKNLNKVLNSGDIIKYLDKVRVGFDSAASLRFVDDTKVTLGENSSLLIDSLIYNPRSRIAEGALNLTSGFLRFASSGKGSGLSIKTPVAAIGVRGTVFDVLATDTQIEVAVHDGEVVITSKNKTASVRSGQVIQMKLDGSFVISRVPSSSLKKAVGNIKNVLKRKDHNFESFKIYQINIEKGNINCNRKIDNINIPESIKNIDKTLIVIIRIKNDNIFIRMRPDIAPNHINRIKTLIRRCFYDGLQFFDVKSNFAAITGDPLNTGKGGSGIKIKAEFSDAPFITGSVGMMRDQKKPNSADSQFFIALKPLPHLIGKYTNWGTVVSGMDKIRGLPVGRPPKNPERILTMRLLSDFVFSP
tara:strand:- start:543 stop:1820 length:1278 start_codon:yes stop_codon:yes gene_type:complete